MSYAQFELSIDDADSVRKSRALFRQANNAMKEADEKEERLMVLEAWKEFEVIACILKRNPTYCKSKNELYL